MQPMLVAALMFALPHVSPWTRRATPGAPTARAASAGDLVLEGHLDANGEVPELTPLEAEKVRSGLRRAKEIDPSRGADLERAYTDGKLRFGRLGNLNLGALGSHDWNTIGISYYSYDDTVIAITMLHEWTHVVRCAGGPTSGGSTNDPSGSTSVDPCGPVVHMHDIADTIGLLCGELGGSAAFCRRCKSLWAILDALYAEAARAAAAGCSTVPAPQTLYDEFCIDACRDCET